MLSIINDVRIMINQLMHSPFKTVLMSAYAVVCVVLISKRKLFVPTYYELFGDAIDPVVIGVAVFILTGGLIFLG